MVAAKARGEPALLISILTPFYAPDPGAPEVGRQWRQWLQALAEQSGPCEVIVAGTAPGPSDPWAEVLPALAGPDYPHQLVTRHLPYRPPQRPAGRAAALNFAAATAHGGVLLLLHADNQLATGALAAVRRAVANGAAAGAFPKRYDQRTALLGLQEWWLNHWRLGLCRRTVGTNAVWMRRELWRPLPDWRLLEDVVLDERLRRAVPLHVEPLPVTVSSAKYLGTGVVRSMAINAAVLALFRFGVPADVLADELYQRGWLPPGRAGFPARLARQIGRCWRLRGAAREAV